MHGWQHTAVNLAALAPISAAGVLFQRTEPLVPFVLGSVFGTLLVTPDLDLRFNDARRRWGALAFLWGPYATFSKHRGMSHSYVIGPLVRLLYLLVMLLPLLALLLVVARAQDWFFTWRLVEPLQRAVMGYMLSQWLHLLCDGILPFPFRKSLRS
ncbi:DUF2227 family putative metal-binding protein [Deinococcus ruber]|uniref:Hydrolase n=1 Tax=Deinococcus ruber TaxID=1848197 RepID=A0A918F6Q9_9DEIO|nr:DUF2227 family putative metal-binding protein [Deinococcus ruber]GGR10120.1 hydrolase [Deinococcus ruber]